MLQRTGALGCARALVARAGSYGRGRAGWDTDGGNAFVTCGEIYGNDQTLGKFSIIRSGGSLIFGGSRLR